MILTNVPLKPYCRYRIGGPSRHFLEVQSTEELVTGLTTRASRGGPEGLFVLGAGCNVLVDDCGYHGLIIHNAIRFQERLSGDRVRVGAGSAVEELLVFCLQNDLAGLEWAGGLPGTVGGAVFGNAGAFGGEVKDRLVAVESLDLETREMRTREAAACGFRYRESLFKRERRPECILAAVFQLEPGNRDRIAAGIAEKVAYRRARHPMEYPSVGSIFKNIPLTHLPGAVEEAFADKIKVDPFPLLPAAVLLAEAGLKGTRMGDIEISRKHPNFFVNTGHGRACDVRQLIRLAQHAVQARFGVALEPEIIEPGCGR